MKLNFGKLALSLGLPLGLGAIVGFLTRGGDSYAQLVQPPLSPPGWLFPVVWTILYALMGYASYRIWTSGGKPEDVRRALIAYSVQLFLNLLWPFVYFRLEWRLAAFFLLVALWVAIYITMQLFSKIDETAADLLIPYLIWVTFAGYLNLGTYLLN